MNTKVPSDRRFTSRLLLPALKIALIYGLASVLWILLSDRLAQLFAADNDELLARLQNAKGLFFVVASAALIFWLVQREHARNLAARNQLTEREQYFRSLFQGAPTAYQSLDAEGRLLDVNQAWLDLLGYDRDDVVGHHMGEFLEASQLVLMQERFPEFKASGRLEDAEFVLTCKDGSKVTVTVNGRIQADAEGTFQRTHCILHDITRRKRDEQALRDSRQQLQLALEGANLGTFEWYVETGRMTWNERQAELYGLDLAGFAGTREAAEERIHPEDRSAIERGIARSRQDGLAYTAEYRTLRPDGSYRWLATSGRVVKQDESGQMVFHGVTWDIDARKRAERDRELIFEYSPDALCVADMSTGSFVSTNPAWTRILGWSSAELQGKPWIEFVHPDDRPATLAVGKELAEGAPALDFRNRYQRRDGTYVWLSWNSFPVPEDNLLFAVARDITAQRELEEQLRQAQKMEAVGQLAGGVAHDFNNLLQVINGHAEMALEGMRADDPARGSITEVSRAGGRAAKLVSQLLAFSRRQVIDPEDLDVNVVVTDMLELIERTLGENIRIDWLPGHRLGTVHADRGQLEQVVMNLCINARDAMPDGGVLNVETENVFFDADYCRTEAWARPGRYVLLSVTDSGQGMDPQTMQHIWEPFFTTKEPGKGTGLGLSTVYGIVRQHEGLVHIYSEPGRGTTFKIYLPLVERPAASVGAKMPRRAEGGSETILVAEDNESVRDLMQVVLERAGYTVLTASDGPEALVLLEERGQDCALAILDVVMPELGGREVYDQVCERLPGLRFLFASGYSLNGVHTNFVLDEGFELIQKPFEGVDLLARVRAILDQE